MKTAALSATAHALPAPKATLVQSLAWVDRLEKRLSPRRPSGFAPLGLCLERALTNIKP